MHPPEAKGRRSSPGDSKRSLPASAPHGRSSCPRRRPSTILGRWPGELRRNGRRKRFAKAAENWEGSGNRCINKLDIGCKCLRFLELEGIESGEVDGSEEELGIAGAARSSRAKWEISNGCEQGQIFEKPASLQNPNLPSSSSGLFSSTNPNGGERKQMGYWALKIVRIIDYNRREALYKWDTHLHLMINDPLKKKNLMINERHKLDSFALILYTLSVCSQHSELDQNRRTERTEEEETAGKMMPWNLPSTASNLLRLPSKGNPDDGRCGFSSAPNTRKRWT